MFQSLLTLFLASTLSFTPVVTNSFDDSVLLKVDPIPQKSVEYLEPPGMSANAVISIDLDSQSVLYEKNSNQRVPIASITKLMTAAVLLDGNTDEIVTVSPNAASTLGSSMGLYSGEEISVRNLLYGLLIESGNDAAIALAEHKAGNVLTFVDMMNQKAEELGLSNTQYNNPSGLDSSLAYSSARDVAILSAHLIQNPDIREIVRQSEVDVTSVNGYVHKLKSTNILLGKLGIQGIKTGKTPAAKENLSSYAISPSGHGIITVVLNSDSRFSETKSLIDWIYKAYTW